MAEGKKGREYYACTRIEYLPLVYFILMFVIPLVLYGTTGSPVVVTFDVDMDQGESGQVVDNAIKLCEFNPKFVHDIVGSNLVAIRLHALNTVYVHFDGSLLKLWIITCCLVVVIGLSAYLQTIALINYFLRDSMTNNNLSSKLKTACFCRTCSVIFALTNFLCDLAIFGYWKEILLLDIFIRFQFARHVWNGTLVEVNENDISLEEADGEEIIIVSVDHI